MSEVDTIIDDINRTINSSKKPKASELLRKVKFILGKINVDSDVYATICYDELPLSERLRCLHIRLKPKQPNLTIVKKDEDTVDLSFDDDELVGIGGMFIHDDELNNILDNMPQILGIIKDTIKGYRQSTIGSGDENRRRWNWKKAKEENDKLMREDGRKHLAGEMKWNKRNHWYDQELWHEFNEQWKKTKTFTFRPRE